MGRSTSPHRFLARALGVVATLAASACIAADEDPPPVELQPSSAHARPPQLPEKPILRSQSELPRFSYELPTATASDLLSDPAFAAVGARVKQDVEQLLAEYDIQDHSTLRDLHRTLEHLALLEGDFDAALAHAEKVRELEDKPAERLTSDLLTVAIVAAARAGPEPERRREAFRAHYAAAVGALPWEIVQDRIEQQKGRYEIASKSFLIGMAQSQYDQAASQSRSISGEVARDLIGMRQRIDVVFPYKDFIIDVLQAYIDEHRVKKADIWAGRAIDLSEDDSLEPVVIGIWDSGVDLSVLGDQVFRNAGETVDGRDDDGDGFVDDVHGIAWELWGGDPTPELLFPLDEAAKQRLGQMRDLVKGFIDLQASIDSSEVRKLKQRMGELGPAEVQPLMEDFWRFMNYMHGTHVAGIAAAGNPAARILVARETFPYEVVPSPITAEIAARWSEKIQRTVDYLERHQARVVNMSWAISAKDIERMLEVNALGSSADERQRMAQESFDVLMSAMRAAMASAPGILFMPAAGNSDEDIGFDVYLPASIDLPNVLTVGAVDQAGDETSFTSYGERVRVHANGFEVDSYIPGGERMVQSGTSMAAPNATNLAAKLFALAPDLTPEQVIDLILEGASSSEDGRRTLIDPRRSVELLRARRHD